MKESGQVERARATWYVGEVPSRCERRRCCNSSRLVTAQKNVSFHEQLQTMQHPCASAQLRPGLCQFPHPGQTLIFRFSFQPAFSALSPLLRLLPLFALLTSGQCCAAQRNSALHNESRDEKGQVFGGWSAALAYKKGAKRGVVKS